MIEEYIVLLGESLHNLDRPSITLTCVIDGEPRHRVDSNEMVVEIDWLDRFASIKPPPVFGNDDDSVGADVPSVAVPLLDVD